MSLKPSVRQQIRDLRGQYFKVSTWLGNLNSALSQYAEVTDILYELHKDEVNKIIERRIKEKKDE